MSSRRPRTRFAAPLVVTLALSPACVLTERSSRPPTAAPTDPSAPQGPVGPTMNPPPPDRVPLPTDPVPPIKQTDPTTDVVQAGPTPQAAPTTWRIWQNDSDKSCLVSMDVSCPPAPATCNPPPAKKLASCPPGVTATSATTIQELAPGECFVMYAVPACPAGMACNPPRPAKIDCPR
jgi:hypothetical protein